MTQTAKQILLLASDHLDKKSAAVRSLGPSVACALTPGEGPSVNPKNQANEDSLGVFELPGGGTAACVADSHWGAGIGEALVRATAASLAASTPGSADALVRLVRELAASARAARPAGDRSETTFLVAIVRGREVVWASIADSHLYRVSAKRAERVNHDLPLFAGADLELATTKGILAFESGKLTLEPGEILLLASDGIDPPMSGLQPKDLAALLAGAGSLEERLRRLVDRARLAPSGGRDNVALVAVADSAQLSR